MSFDPSTIRPLFPALAQEVTGRPAVFFDGPGGTQVPQMVIDAISGYLARDNANTHGAFATSQRTDATIAAAHAAMADLLGCDPDEVFFGQNMTSLTFALSRAIGRELQPGDEIVVTRLDHDANVAPWRALSERGVVIREVDIDIEDCTLDMADMAAKIGPRTKLVAVGYASNAVGTINDVRQVVEWAHQAGALVFVDAVHYAPHGPIDVKALDCDFLACSVYKFFGPHVGVIYGKREHLQRLQPYKVRPAADTAPERWMTGTQNHEGLAGVTAAIEYLASLGQLATSRREALVTAMTRIADYERSLAVQLIEGLLTIPGLTFYGIRKPERFGWRTPTVSFRLANLSPRAVGEQLAERGIFVWDGNYYALRLSERLGVEPLGGMVRVGLVHYNTAAEVDYLLEVLRKLATR
ncbi:cysteine desulfurase-like protein [Chloroflexus sp.]|uniref:cysteine desulfurase-like protein n=1 Tax=Chloroflexus sp. TaxID=1904827 RepID=UPI002ACD8AE2|nr:cysteine desulfurase-like protein [Chloroflexus sp.]